MFLSFLSQHTNKVCMMYITGFSKYVTFPLKVGRRICSSITKVTAIGTMDLEGLNKPAGNKKILKRHHILYIDPECLFYNDLSQLLYGWCNAYEQGQFHIHIAWRLFI